MAAKREFSDQAVDAAKQLAPWSTRIPWWVVLIEGIVVGAVGLLAVIDPGRTNETLALALTFALLIAGLTQVWALMRSRIPDKIDAGVAARAGIAVYAGLVVLILYFLGEDATTGGRILTRVAGYGIFGTAAVVYGLLALVQVIRTDGSSRRQALIEFLLFTAAGVITLWGLFSGSESIAGAVRIVGWIFIVAGVALIGLSIWRRQKGDEADEMIESVTGTISGGAESVAAIGRKKEPPAGPPDEAGKGEVQ
jgi:hypothetical protein